MAEIFVARLKVTSSAGIEVLRGFDHAWTRAYELPTPVQIELLGFVRR